MIPICSTPQENQLLGAPIARRDSEDSKLPLASKGDRRLPASGSGDNAAAPRSGGGLIDLDLSLLSSGDPAEWKRFLEASQGIIHAAGYKIGLRGEERDDLSQITYVICFQSIAKLRDPSSLGSWVYRIAYRQGLKIIRNRSPQTESEEQNDWLLQSFASTDPSEEEVLERNEEALQLRKVVVALGDPCRKLLQKLYFEEVSPAYEDVSRSLGMPIGSIGPTRARCLDRARSKLKPVSEEGQLGTLDQMSGGSEP